MNLMPHINSPKQAQRLKKLAFKGLFNYQPFVVAENFEVGSGISIIKGLDDVPSVICDAPPFFAIGSESAKFLAKQEQIEETRDSNRRLNELYDAFINQICLRLGDVSNYSMLDVGCNAGYFPISFALKGFKHTVGYDRVNYQETFDALNDILGTKSKFFKNSYNGEVENTDKKARFDVVISIAVLVHLSDPLHHMAYLASMTKKAMFIFTPCHDDGDNLSIVYHAANRYYKDDKFPYCFDTTTISRSLLRFSLEKLGFSEMHDFIFPKNVMPESWNKVHRGILAIR